MNAAALLQLLQHVPPGQWAAITPDATRVIATATDGQSAMAQATAAGEANPIVVRVPTGEWGAPPAPARNLKPPPFEMMAIAVDAESVVAFLGAGASLVGRQGGVAYDETQPFLPNSAELMALLADKSHFPADELEQSDLARVSSYFEWRGGRNPLKHMLRRAIGPRPAVDGRRCEPGKLHRLLAREPRIRFIITTNYDTLIEDAFTDAGRPFDLLIYPAESQEFRNAAVLQRSDESTPIMAEPNTVKLDFTRTIIFKMHGTLASQSQGDAFVITEEDYLEFLSRMVGKTAIPAPVLSYLIKKNVLFLGYGLRDWNLRLLLKQLSPLDKSWAIQRRVTAVEERLWASRDVDIFENDLDDFADNLQLELDKLRPYQPHS